MLHHVRKIITSENKFVPAVKPSNIPFDATLAPNNVAVWDGDVTLTNLAWIDTAALNTITMFNLPIVNPIGLNAHGTVLFNGINQYGNTVTPVIAQPYTIYIVLRLPNVGNAETIIDDGTTASECEWKVVPLQRKIKVSTSTGNITSDNLGANFQAVTFILNSANSLIKVGLNAAITGDLGSDQREGIQLAANLGLTVFYPLEVAYIIMRSVADPSWLQNNIINWLKTRFAI